MRLSGDGGEAGGVRCSRGLGAANPGIRWGVALCLFINAKISKLFDTRIMLNDMSYADNAWPLVWVVATAAKELPIAILARYQEDRPYAREDVRADEGGKVVSAKGVHLSAPNSLRLSGDDGEAGGVRCSRRLGDRSLLGGNNFGAPYLKDIKIICQSLEREKRFPTAQRNRGGLV